MEMKGTAGDLDHIDSVGFQHFAEFDAVFQLITVIHSFFPGNSGFNDEVRATVFTDLVYHHHGETGAVFQTAAKFIGTGI